MNSLFEALARPRQQIAMDELGLRCIVESALDVRVVKATGMVGEAAASPGTVRRSRLVIARQSVAHHRRPIMAYQRFGVSVLCSSS